MIQEIEMNFEQARQRMQGIVLPTPLMYHARLSEKYESRIYCKREDLQMVRSYKIRGAYNMISSLSATQLANGVVCASAGNHAQGVAYCCQRLGISCTVFMPLATPKQKIQRTQRFGGHHVQIRLVGNTYDDCAKIATEYVCEHGGILIPPFDHPAIIEGQGTIGVEILQQMHRPDFVFMPVGGGGLAAGIGAAMRQRGSYARLIGAEPMGAPSMTRAWECGAPVLLDDIDPFVDGASVSRVGDVTYGMCRRYLDEMCLADESRVCATILELYSEDAMVVEPAGALSISVLDAYASAIKGKNVVCVVSGGNNDIGRIEEIKKRALGCEFNVW